jgi:hypothetical protein
MANAVTASIVVSFDNQSDSSAIFSAEVDGRQDGLNLGNTSFSPGDDVGILLHKSSNVVLDYYSPSYGSLAASGSITYEVEEQFLVFAGTNTQSVSYPIVSGFSYSWLGNNLGSIVHTENSISLSNKALYPEGGNFVGVAKVNYVTRATPFWLRNTHILGEDTYEIACFFVGHTG